MGKGRTAAFGARARRREWLDQTHQFPARINQAYLIEKHTLARVLVDKLQSAAGKADLFHLRSTLFKPASLSGFCRGFLGNLLRRGETRLYGDSAYRGQQVALKAKAPKAKDFTNKPAYRNTLLTEQDKEVNRTKSQTRAEVEHPFFTLKCIWGFAKVRHQGFAGNANRTLALIKIDK